jgi:integrase
MPIDIFLRGRIWYMRGSVRGTPVYESTKAPEDRKDLAEAARAKRETELFEADVFGKRPSVPFRAGALAYLAFQPRSQRTIDYTGAQQDDGRWTGLIGHFAETAIETISQSEADEAARKICGADSLPATRVRGVYTPLIAVLNFAAGRKWCAPPEITKPRIAKNATRWLYPDQAMVLIQSAAPHLRPLILFMLCTGARVAEALELDWSDVDLMTARVVFRGTKAEALSNDARPRIARLPPAAVLSLANLPMREGRVFRRDDGEPYADTGRYSGGQITSAWATACGRAGLPGQWVDRKQVRRFPARWVRAAPHSKSDKRVKRPGYTRIDMIKTFVPEVTPHDCRHSWATWFYCLSKDLLLLKDEGGWASLTVVERYAHLAPSDIAPAITEVWGGDHPRLIAAQTNIRAKGVQ